MPDQQLDFQSIRKPLVLVSGATRSVERFAAGGFLGRLFVPGAGNDPRAGTALPWAADNGAFTGFDEQKFLRMLRRLKGVPGCLFVVCPDVVGDSEATMDLFQNWHLRLRRQWPLAFVAQDGQQPEFVPWSQFRCLFIGGSTEFKLSPLAHRLCQEAKTRGKWLHMGRVNSFARMEIALRWGCDSIDGTSFSMFGDVHIPRAQRWLKAMTAPPPPTPEPFGVDCTI